MVLSARALLAVILERQITAQVPGVGSSVTTGTGSIPSALRQHVAGQIATAFAHTFWWSVGIAVLALIPALFLSRESATRSLPAPPGAGTRSNVSGTRQRHARIDAGGSIEASVDPGEAVQIGAPVEAAGAGHAGAHRHRQRRSSPLRRVTPPKEN